MKPKNIICLALALSGVLLGCFTNRGAGAEPAVNSTTNAAVDAFSAKTPDPATPEQMQWWRDARFGMFIHWDMSSIAGTEISWSRNGSKPLDIGRHDPAGYVEDPVYDHLYEKFNPTNFNAKQWVKLAQAAGMKYIVFTAKHHGGFCMWDTKLTDYSIMHAPFHRDVVKELADACHAAGMRFGIYYSPRDWHNPDYGIGDNRKYVDYMNGQLRELLTNYGKVDVIWFDSYGRGDLVDFWRIGETFDLIKTLQPDILVNNRLAVLGGYNKQPAPYRGDFDTPEQKVGAFQNTRPWESCMSIVTAHGGGWSYRPDGKVKSFSQCIQNLVSCAVGDGNLLLDVGPNSLGEIPADQAGRLLEIGKWMDKYGDSIYGTRGGPYHNGPWGGSTCKGSTVYLHVFQWNGGQLQLPALKSKILKCRLMGKSFGGGVKFEQTKDAVTFILPAAKQDKVDTVLELQLADPAANEFIDGKPVAVQTGKST
jgi:alpha-L-fucosidase